MTSTVCDPPARTAALPRLQADLLLLHPPAVFDFRRRRDLYFPFLGTSGDVPITPLYEYFPVGFKTLQRHLGERGFEVRLLNLATVLLRYPALDVDRLLESLDVRLVGIDLHWMVHVQGSLAVAERIHRVRPDLRVILGGISSTWYAEELIRYPFVDLVMRGYDTHEPMHALLRALGEGGPLDAVPNLLWKTRAGDVRVNAVTDQPAVYGCGIDWSRAPVPNGRLAVRELLSTHNAGCAHDCPWCGGSRTAFRRVFQCGHALARKPDDEIAYEFASLRRRADAGQHHFYAVGTYNHTGPGLERLIDQIGETGFRSVSYEQFHLTPEPVLARMVRANRRTTLTLSPESHDRRISRLAGRGAYSNEELERWIERALALGIHGIDLWYFVGMPEQDERSVRETVAYCERLLDRFHGRNVVPMVCPMIPFLDPASTIFEQPERFGYTVFHRTVEQHRRAMERASILHRVNYETRWLSRRDLVRVGYRAVRDVMEARAGHGLLPRANAADFAARIDDALAFIDVVHEADALAEPRARARALAALGDEILRRNDALLVPAVANQSFPIWREIGGRWFDELGWPPEALAAANAAAG